MVAISRKVSSKDMMYMLLTGEKLLLKEAFKLINIVTEKEKFNKKLIKFLKK